MTIGKLKRELLLGFVLWVHFVPCLQSACSQQPPPGGGEGTSYKWANGDVPLHGVAFSLGGGSGIMNHKS